MTPTGPFPIYRKLPNERSFYRIRSVMEFTEVQVFGSQCVAHQVVAVAYPERLRIAELIAMEGDVLRSDETEFASWLARCGQ